MADALGVSICTWNVATIDPPEQLSQLLERLLSFDPDVCIIGLQEVSSKPHEIVQAAFVDDPWTEAMDAVMKPRHLIQLKSTRLQGLLLVVYTKLHHLPFMHNLMANVTRTGIAGLWGNKGSATLRMDWYGRSLCFSNWHLTPHADQWDKRCKETQQIFEDQNFNIGNTMNIMDHSFVFIFGDLNFRLEGMSREKALNHLVKNELEPLKEKDQLRITLRDRDEFEGYAEGEISFPPTYKFDPGTHDYDTSPKQRVPAWTDRILWKEDTGTDPILKQLEYHSHPDMDHSDHRPVSAYFQLKLPVDGATPLVRFDPVRTLRCGQNAVCSYSIAQDTKTSSWDWLGLYSLEFSSIERDYKTYVWADARSASKQSGKYQVTFQAEYLPDDCYDKFVLCYYSSVMECTLGVSAPFKFISKTTEMEMSEFQYWKPVSID
ncbi:phosphatidylinositol 4,5-bisphosphate 5-phosphatase A-like [Anneissia japonica]|uniref:phosphatidylinositol 4,5-bisphosphate 5-phosphatase A-like n=1 Tax=Anneissia japonica TaxID=1529436 RepID=UPI00142599D7|nr:phosphatidylinositol 4,5-bisphosphate 5-phosphatase A-like [Anneissia japonica]XP_033123321.1 phosphatidylinositol 4,5-bisphosphate 5-phosphatase A-like [Anneissia japonica]XP_033123322.1 phosphatidylinositol 4,5-bisphosphate 5-phosphatase A-like [Anneissia japonica]